ncbi:MULTISPECIES: NnrS family protein [unclassified Neisseria]|uniref:NnrS family protein n=1 Tax=unclassified Neisseria TaxID=2623750 RepID=UPI002666C545|nr:MULTISPECIES: NnrS family protein [unclassified Neisseria]MDO1510471.1 NnrS family protein [Neisseria sp. MVDL19-042950]MDO1516640.1 NnrS family protein [Neisseria sp. MVDL18-041461]MDO1563786.1 NnrS family protein [Neisseria sp. MVDL20-010259]
MNSLFNHPVWAMAFRPFYILAALFGALSVLLWGFGYQGTIDLPSFYWHAHEMIWGYSGAVVVGFLLTAVATWTGQPPTRGGALFGLALLWLLARAAMYFPHGVLLSGILGTLFFWYAAVCMAIPVIKSRNSRNYIAVVALFLFGLTHAVFHLYLHPFQAALVLNGLLAGLIMVAGFIGLVGMRIMPFFTAKRLSIPQVASPLWVALSALVLPMFAAILMMLQTTLPLAALCAVAAGAINCVQLFRWWHKNVLREPMLWVLFAGYLFTALGLLVMGIAYWLTEYLSLGVHLIGVGGIGLLTVGMMARSALGHTGHPIYPAPKGMPLAFWLMVAATFVRVLAAFTGSTAYTHSIRFSAVLFALSLLLYAWRYLPWLLTPRADGKPG